MIDEEQENIVGCIYYEDTPLVPSTEVLCRDCHCKLWVSNTTLEQLPDCTTLCIPCLIKRVADSDIEEPVVNLPPWQRDELKGSGLSEADIDRTVEIAQAITKLGVRHTRDQ